jgi:hypothetical protein
MDVFIMMTSGRAPRQPSPRLCLPHCNSPRHFSLFLFSPRYPPVQSWIVICPLPFPPLLTLSFPRSLALVSVTTCPCHLIFSHPPHTRPPPTKRHQSHLRSSDPRTSRFRILPHPLTSLLPHLPLPLSSSVFPAHACASNGLPRVLKLHRQASRFYRLSQQHLSRSTSRGPPTPSSPSHLVPII